MANLRMVVLVLLVPAVLAAGCGREDAEPERTAASGAAAGQPGRAGEPPGAADDPGGELMFTFSTVIAHAKGLQRKTAELVEAMRLVAPEHERPGVDSQARLEAAKGLALAANGAAEIADRLATLAGEAELTRWPATAAQMDSLQQALDFTLDGLESVAENLTHLRPPQGAR